MPTGERHSDLAYSPSVPQAACPAQAEGTLLAPPCLLEGYPCRQYPAAGQEVATAVTLALEAALVRRWRLS